MPQRFATSRSPRSAPPESRRASRGDSPKAKRAAPTPVGVLRERLLAHIEAAAGRLQSRHAITDADIHEARKSIKRARATLRLLQPAFDAAATDRSRVALRDAGRALSSARDAKVMADRFDEMRRRCGIDEFAVSTLPRSNSTRAGSAVRRTDARHRSDPAAARDGLLHAHDGLAAAPFVSTGWAPLAQGLRAIYKRGRRDLPRDAGDASSEALHEWRKRVKSYLHALEALAGSKKRPPAIREAISSARRLADALGEEHDLALLADALRASAQSEDVRVARLLGGIVVRRGRLRRRALKLGTALYAEPPAAMIRKLRRAA